MKDFDQYDIADDLTANLKPIDLKLTQYSM